MMDELLLPFQFPFLQNAFLITVMLSVPAAILSCFLVLKGWSLMGDAISHAVFPGIVIAYVIGIPVIIGAFVAGMTCAILTGYIDENTRVKRDTVMGVVFSAMFGIGLVLYTKVEPGVHLEHLLFGNMLGVSPFDMWQTGIIAVCVTLGLAFFWRDLLLHAFDEQQARALGLNVQMLHFGLLAVISLTVVAALKAVGIILAIAFLICPGAVAFLVTRRFGQMIFVAIGVAVFSSVAGIYASVFIDSAPAPTIVLIMSALFVAAFANSIRRNRAAETKRPFETLKAAPDRGRRAESPRPGGRSGAA